MHAIRTEMRAQRPSNISVPQFRCMAFLSRHGGASLSDVAEHVGLTLPSVSNMVERLFERGLVNREILPEDRRRVTLSLTHRGRTMLESARAAAQSSLAAHLALLPPAKRRIVRAAMEILRGLFARPPRPETTPRR